MDWYIIAAVAGHIFMTPVAMDEARCKVVLAEVVGSFDKAKCVVDDSSPPVPKPQDTPQEQ